jgi:hypothetical protein
MLDGTNICATADSRKVKPRAVHMPLKLSDAELDAVLQAARPLPIGMRDPFLQAVAHALAGRDVIGPGVVHQVVRELQRQFFDPPDLSHAGGGSKYR